MSAGGSPRAGRLVGAAGLAAVGFFVWNIARFFPNAAGHLGLDYGLFLPWLVAGRFWQMTNGMLSPPGFLPSFCAGVPFVFNPQSLYYSVPQWLLTVLPPVQSLLASWLVFGLAGGLGMYGLLRRVFRVSVASALLGGTMFLLNGFYTTRMIFGHATYHGVMLLPAIGLTILDARQPAILLRSALTGVLLAYLFYSGGTNVILPILLALAILALMVRHAGLWPAASGRVAAMGGLLGLALCAYKLLPALAFAANVVRPVALRMTGDPLALIGGAGVSLFLPQVLSFLPPERLVVDRVELEYGVGLVPLLVLGLAVGACVRHRETRSKAIRSARERWAVLAGIALLLTIPMLVNYDGLGLRWLILHLPVVRSMSVMLRFWFAYIPILCVGTALALDWLVRDADRRMTWSAAAIALTILQSAATDMRYYAAQPYDPGPMTEADARLRLGGAVPAVTRVADPWNGQDGRPGSSRNDSFVEGISDFPCYEPMFGYRMQVFPLGRLAPGPALQPRDGHLNLKNPVCYVFPKANHCAPGDEFTIARNTEAAAFIAYRPYDYAWPSWQYVAAGVSLVALAGCGGVLLVLGPISMFSRIK